MSRTACDHVDMASEPPVTLSGDIGEYIVKDRRPNGELTLVPDTVWSRASHRGNGPRRSFTVAAPLWFHSLGQGFGGAFFFRGHSGQRAGQRGRARYGARFVRHYPCACAVDGQRRFPASAIPLLA